MFSLEEQVNRLLQTEQPISGLADVMQEMETTLASASHPHRLAHQWVELALKSLHQSSTKSFSTTQQHKTRVYLFWLTWLGMSTRARYLPHTHSWIQQAVQSKSDRVVKLLRNRYIQAESFEKAQQLLATWKKRKWFSSTVQDESSSSDPVPKACSSGQEAKGLYDEARVPPGNHVHKTKTAIGLEEIGQLCERLHPSLSCWIPHSSREVEIPSSSSSDLHSKSSHTCSWFQTRWE